jgi:UDP-glucose 4-epimerase
MDLPAMKILVTGGAGYVGSHVVRTLLDADHHVVIVDDLSSGHRVTVPDGVPVHVGRCGDAAVLDAASEGGRPDAVMHMAASCSVSESVELPQLYYRNNLLESLALMDWMAARRVPFLVHSSTCAVYGIPERQPVNEDTEARPINPYGATKLAVDRAIQYYSDAKLLTGIALRYFNAAGAHPDGSLGEDKTPASNLFPVVFDVALGRTELVEVYGDDYPTPDGTGVRDYVHVLDLAAGHVAALEKLSEGHAGGVFNLGSEDGHSVLEVVESARRITGHTIPVRLRGRRPGDPAMLVADSQRAERDLGWTAQRSQLDALLSDAWAWRVRHPDGYGSAETDQ